MSTCRLCGNRIIRHPKYDFEQQNEEFLETFLLAMAKEMHFVFKLESVFLSSVCVVILN